VTATREQRGSVISLAPGLHALCNPYALDGRVTTYPAEHRGYAAMNCYLLSEGDDSLLIDTGLTVHQDAILAQLTELLSEQATLSVLPLRFGEFGAVCNVRSIAERFGVARLYGRFFGEPWEWLDFRPDLDRPDAPPGGALRRITSEQLPSSGPIAVDQARRRILRTLPAPVRLLAMPWAYDEATRTLFTTEVFGWITRSTPDGPWAASVDDAVSAEFVYEMLVRNRFWWMPGGSLGRLRADLETVFETHEIDTIAPGYGAILKGRDVVEQNVALLDEAMALAERRPSIGVEVGTWHLEGRR
jgi:hypothetical protein